MARRGERRLPELCVSRLREADLILHAGDVSTVAELTKIGRNGPPGHARHRHVEEPALKELLPAASELELNGVRIAITHDAGASRGRLQRMRDRFPHAAAVVFGHSHIPLCESNYGFQLFNPGSPTDRRRSPRHTIGIAHVLDGTVSFEHVAL